MLSMWIVIYAVLNHTTYYLLEETECMDWKENLNSFNVENVI